jgi:hypothetical protein
VDSNSVFNQTLTAELHTLAKVLRWSGLFHETEILRSP